MMPDRRRPLTPEQQELAERINAAHADRVAEAALDGEPRRMGHRSSRRPDEERSTSPE